MVDIEPFQLWQDSHYISEEDTHSPFYGKEYNDYVVENMVYNYYIHPRWDFFLALKRCMPKFYLLNMKMARLLLSL